MALFERSRGHRSHCPVRLSRKNGSRTVVQEGRRAGRLREGFGGLVGGSRGRQGGSPAGQIHQRSNQVRLSRAAFHTFYLNLSILLVSY